MAAFDMLIVRMQKGYCSVYISSIEDTGTGYNYFEGGDLAGSTNLVPTYPPYNILQDRILITPLMTCSKTVTWRNWMKVFNTHSQVANTMLSSVLTISILSMVSSFYCEAGDRSGLWLRRFLHHPNFSQKGLRSRAEVVAFFEPTATSFLNLTVFVFLIHPWLRTLSIYGVTEKQ